MLRPPTDNLSIKLFDPVIDESSIHRALSHPNPHLLKDGGSRTVWKSALSDNSPVIIKCRAKSSLSFLRMSISRSPLQNELRGLRALASLNILASKPIAYIRAADSEAIVLSYISGPTLLELISWHPLTITQEKALCRALATQIRAVLRASHFNRDNKPSNLIVTGDFTNPSIAIIDAAGIQSSFGHTFALRLMLASLYIEPYGCKNTIRNALCMRMLHAVVLELGASSQDARRDARNLWRIVQNQIEYHGDPVPRHLPMIIPSPEISRPD